LLITFQQANFSSLKMETIVSFETSVVTTPILHHSLEDDILHNNRLENLKTYIEWDSQKGNKRVDWIKKGAINVAWSNQKWNEEGRKGWLVVGPCGCVNLLARLQRAYRSMLRTCPVPGRCGELLCRPGSFPNNQLTATYCPGRVAPAHFYSSFYAGITHRVYEQATAGVLLHASFFVFCLLY
jgi:hypothetical protein